MVHSGLVLHLAIGAAAVEVEIPYARAALFASDLPELRACDGGIGSPGCDPYKAMMGWRYAVNNMRRATDLLPAETRSMHKSTVALVAQISTELQAFFEQPTETTFMVAVSNARQVFDALSGWMSTSPPSSVEMDDGAAVGVPFLYGGQSMRILADPGAGPGDAKVAESGRLRPSGAAS